MTLVFVTNMNWSPLAPGSFRRFPFIYDQMHCLPSARSNPSPSSIQRLNHQGQMIPSQEILEMADGG
jgi:hypothetical protein